VNRSIYLKLFLAEVFFQPKMHQIALMLSNSFARTRWGSLQRSPRPYSWIKWNLLLRECDGKGVEGGEEKRTGGKGGLEGEGIGGRGEGRSREPPFMNPRYAPVTRHKQ